MIAGRRVLMRRWPAVLIGVVMATGIGGGVAVSAGSETPTGEASAQQSSSQNAVVDNDADGDEGTQAGLEPQDASSGGQSGTQQSSVDSTPAVSPVPSTTGTDQSAVVPSVVSATYQSGVGIVVRAIVLDVLDDAGACTLEATGPDGVTARRSEGEAIPSVDSMNCVPGMTIPDSALVDGKWCVTITYESEEHTGISHVEEVEVHR